jgi:hypothetical protein
LANQEEDEKETNVNAKKTMKKKKGTAKWAQSTKDRGPWAFFPPCPGSKPGRQGEGYSGRGGIVTR